MEKGPALELLSSCRKALGDGEVFWVSGAFAFKTLGCDVLILQAHVV